MIDTTPRDEFGNLGGRDEAFHGWMDINFPMPPFDSARDILNRSISVYFENLGLIVMLVLLLLAPPLALEYLLLALVVPPGNAALVEAVGAVGMGVNYLMSWLMMPALIYGIVVRLRDRRAAGLGECLSWGVSKWLPTTGWGIVTVALMLFGCVLLVVPGLLVMTWLYMITAVVAIEGPSRGNAFSRCIELTRGHAWRVFGVLLVFLLVFFGFGVAHGAFADYLVTAGMYPTGATDWVVSFGAALFYELLWPMMTVSSVLMYLGIRATGRPTRCAICDYPLTGNTTGYCPECGEPLPDDAVTELPA